MPLFSKKSTCSQSYKRFTIELYDSSVVLTRKLPTVRLQSLKLQLYNVYKIGRKIEKWYFCERAYVFDRNSVTIWLEYFKFLVI